MGLLVKTTQLYLLLPISMHATFSEEAAICLQLFLEIVRDNN